MTQEALALKCGYTSRSTIAKIEAGGTDIPLPKIILFARALGTTPMYLMGWDEEPENYDESELVKENLKKLGIYIKNYRNANNLTRQEFGEQSGLDEEAVELFENFNPEKAVITKEKGADLEKVEKRPYSSAIRVPVFGTVPAGIPFEAIEEILDYEEIPREMTAGGKEYFGLRVQGDSMEDDYKDGDTILVLRQNDCESGQIAVVYVNGFDATLKRVVKMEDSIILQPLNPAYDPVVYRLDDPDNPVIILGVVVEIRRKV